MVRPMVNSESNPGTARVVWEGPQERDTFRMGQLLLLLNTAESVNVKITSLDRLAYFDFFAANPFIAINSSNERKDSREELTLRLAGFTSGQIDYGSIGPRFITRRARIKYDLISLLARGLAEISDNEYKISARGAEISDSLNSLYAESYRTAAGIVLSRYGRMTDLKIQKIVESAIGVNWLTIDFLDGVETPETDGEDK